MKRVIEPLWPEIEALLESGGVDLDRICAALRLPRDGWLGIPSLRTLAPTLAAEVLTVRIRASEPRLSRAAALRKACDRLGLSFWDHTSVIKRERRRAKVGDKLYRDLKSRAA